MVKFREVMQEENEEENENEEEEEGEKEGKRRKGRGRELINIIRALPPPISLAVSKGSAPMIQLLGGICWLVNMRIIENE